eukprot:TRINITY_DN4631_c0_g1_i1.p1 TRINITY_DN4631_c0_g1~~TRINITY_DN4631_c0_g1_i1.p1  ORF type:complete len:402 (+),score=46.04 TRINITY_DN4631_c0_g1_i1:30-1235(+)
MVPLVALSDAIPREVRRSSRGTGLVISVLLLLSTVTVPTNTFLLLHACGHKAHRTAVALRAKKRVDPERERLRAERARAREAALRSIGQTPSRPLQNSVAPATPKGKARKGDPERERLRAERARAREAALRSIGQTPSRPLQNSVAPATPKGKARKGDPERERLRAERARAREAALRSIGQTPSHLLQNSVAPATPKGRAQEVKRNRKKVDPDRESMRAEKAQARLEALNRIGQAPSQTMKSTSSRRLVRDLAHGQQKPALHGRHPGAKTRNPFADDFRRHKMDEAFKRLQEAGLDVEEGASQRLPEAKVRPRSLGQTDDPMGQRFDGIVKHFSGSFGFISCSDLQASFGGKDVFLHRKQLVFCDKLREGDAVNFRLHVDSEGSPIAEDVQLVDDLEEDWE